MVSLFTSLARFIDRPLSTPQSPAQRLMEQAGARAGHDVQQVHELRQAACALLRVVR